MVQWLRRHASTAGGTKIPQAARPAPPPKKRILVAKTWKQPKCPSTDEWIKKMWYIYTMEYYSAIKKNAIMPFVATWMDLEIIIQSKPDSERQISYVIAYMRYLKKNDTNELIYKTEIGLQT